MKEREIMKYDEGEREKMEKMVKKELKFEYVCWVSDQDTYALSGQKCSAQSIVFAHENWMKNGFVEKSGELAKRRRLEDLTISPVMTWNNQKIADHIEKVRIKIINCYLMNYYS